MSVIRPDRLAGILAVPRHRLRDGLPLVAHVGYVTNFVPIPKELPQLMGGIVPLNPVGEPHGTLYVHDPACVAIPGGFAGNAMSVDDCRVAQFPFAPRRLWEGQRHIPAFREPTSLGIVPHCEVQ